MDSEKFKACIKVMIENDGIIQTYDNFRAGTSHLDDNTISILFLEFLEAVDCMIKETSIPKEKIGEINLFKLFQKENK